MAQFIYLYRGRPPRCPSPRRSRAPSETPRSAPGCKSLARRSSTSAARSGRARRRDDGSEGTAGDLIGYSIVEADDLAAAKAYTDGLPFVSNSDG
jgi:hypothetical protein